MDNNIFAKLKNLNIEDCATVVFDRQVHAYLRDKHSQLNSQLAIKEAASWKAASELVLTD